MTQDTALRYAMATQGTALRYAMATQGTALRYICLRRITQDIALLVKHESIFAESEIQAYYRNTDTYPE